jgi:hypothetical protein
VGRPRAGACATDTLFLVEMDSGWRVATAGRTRSTEGTYECLLGLMRETFRWTIFLGYYACNARFVWKEVGMKRFLRNNGLSVAFGLLFLVTLLGQAIAGHADYNHRQLLDGDQPITFWHFLAVGVPPVLPLHPRHRVAGAARFTGVQEARRDRARVRREATDRAGCRAGLAEVARTGGRRTAVFSRSLCLVMGGLFLLSWPAQSIAGLSAFNEEQLSQLAGPMTWPQYVASADFWNRTLQNWQSEFLAIGSMAVLSVYLRQRGSPESKPVGTPHGTTETSG